MKVDYIIVGCGIAGINFCEELMANNKTFIVFDNDSQQASTVAGGLYNPVTLKRFTPVWRSKEQLEIALPVYAKIEKRLNIKLDYKVPVYRRFTSLEEQNDWFAASDKAGLSDYMSTKIHKNNNECIDAEFGFGEVLHTGRIDTKLLIEAYKNYLKTNELLIENVFKYEAIEDDEGKVVYENYEAKHIIFAEGFGIKSNLFFNYLPLIGSKGELLTIHAPNLKLEFVLKSSVFVIPLGDNLYRIGSTYDWKDKTNETTSEAKEILLSKFKTFTNCDFEVVDQVAGIRPTVQNRRPLVGTHHNFNNYHVLNGLGTRGVMIGPYVAKQLYHFVENKKPLDEAIDIKRFKKNN